MSLSFFLDTLKTLSLLKTSLERRESRRKNKVGLSFFWDESWKPFRHLPADFSSRVLSALGVFVTREVADFRFLSVLSSSTNKRV